MEMDQVLALAKSAGFPCCGDEPIIACGRENLQRFAALVAAAVKEDDARIIVDLYDRTETRNINDFAAAIRASIKEGK